VIVEFPALKFKINSTKKTNHWWLKKEVVLEILSLPSHASKTDGTGHDAPHVQIYQGPHCQSEAAYFHPSILQSVHCFHTAINKCPKLSNQSKKK